MLTNMPQRTRPEARFAPRRGHEGETPLALRLHFGAWLVATLSLLLIHDEPTKMALVVGLYLEFRRTSAGARRGPITKIINP